MQRVKNLTAVRRGQAAIVVARMILGGVASLALVTTGLSYSGSATDSSTIRPGGPRTGTSNTGFLNVEGDANGTNASFGVLDFNSANFGIGGAVQSISNLTLTLSESNAGFTLPGTLNFYLTQDTATNIKNSPVNGVGSPLKYDASFGPEGLGMQLSPFTLLGTGTFSTTGNTNTGKLDTYTLTLSADAQNYFVGQLNSGGTLRLVITPTTSTTAATFAGPTTTTMNTVAPMLSFDATLNQPSLTWKGGAGAWNPPEATTDTSWSGGPWNSARTAIFNSPGGAVTLSAPITAVGMTFNATGYTINGGANPLTLTGGFVQVTNAADTATVGAVIAGTVGLIKNGAGTLILSGQNTYTGTTAINVGAISVSSDANLGAAANGVALNNGTLRTGAAFTMGSSRTLSGTGTLDMAGGALTVSGPVAAGALSIINGTATFNGSGIAFSSAVINAGATLSIANTYTGFPAAPPTPAPRTVFSGDGTVVLATDNSGYAGGFTMNRGTGTAGPTVILGSGGSLGGNTLFLNGGTLQALTAVMIANAVSLGGNATFSGASPIEFAGGFGLFGASSKLLTINVDTLISSGITPDTGTNPNNSLNKAGSARLTLSSPANTYNGGTNITGGTLEVGPNGTLGQGTVTITATMATGRVTLQIDNNAAIDDLSKVLLVSSGANRGVIDLEFDGSEQIAALVIDGVDQGGGTFNATTTPDFLFGRGNLVVVPEPSAWVLLTASFGALAAMKLRRPRGEERTDLPALATAPFVERRRLVPAAGQRGFTLLELLVVIAIIGVLAAIALPMASSMRRKSNQVISLSNLRQWGGALVSSISDYNDTLPWEGQAINTARADAWYNRLPPYMGEKPYSQRRTSELPRAGQKSVWVNPAVPASVNAKYTPYLFCYSMNYYLSTAAEPTMRSSKVTHLAATVFMAEGTDEFANCNPKYIKAYFGTGSIDTDPNNSAHFLFCDGHVRMFTRKEFDPNFGSQSTNEANPDETLTFVPYAGAGQQ